MSNLNDMGDWLSVELHKTLDSVALEVSTALSLCVEELTATTPVDTSKALSNWQVSIGNPIGSDINAHFQGKKGSTAGVSAIRAIAIADAVLNARKFGEPAYLVNNVDYMVDLNSGSSQQAPAGGFFDDAIDNLDQRLNLISGGK